MAETAASWLMLELLQERVQGIARTAGYMTDLGAGPVLIDEGDALDDDTAGTVIEAGLVTVTSASATAVNFDMDITVEFSVKRDGAAGGVYGKEQMHRCLLDLARALLIKDRELPRFVRTFEQTGAQLADAADERGASYLVAQVTARAGLTQIHQPAT